MSTHTRIAVTAAREVEEETGWRPRGMRLLTRFQPLVGTADFENLIFLGEGVEDPGAPPDINEAASMSVPKMRWSPPLWGLGR
jgi:8-oxo-dGTP pyrophosphatase MutT (NUDIX family)